MIFKKVRTVLSIGPKRTLEVARQKVFTRIHRVAPYKPPKWPKISPADYSKIQSLYDVEGVASTLDLLSEPEKRAIIEQADAVCDHVFDFLGSGPTRLGPEIDWRTDFKSGRTWPLVPPGRTLIIDLEDDSDIKVVWELSRHQHFVTLGQAYALTGNAKYAVEFKEQIESWIKGNTFTMGPNWACSMDIGLRAVSWIWAIPFFDAAPEIDKVFWNKFYSALVAHGMHVSEHIEDWGGIRNNHYMSNGTALAIMGMALPNYALSSEWLTQGWSMLEECMRDQILPDGANYEMSTAYHRLITELLLTPALHAKRVNYDVPTWYWEKGERLLEFTQAMMRPDEGIALFGDADDGRCQTFSQHNRVNVNDHRYLLSLGAALYGRSDFAHSAERMWEEAIWLFGPESLKIFDDVYVAEQEISRGTIAFPDAGFYSMQNDTFWVFADCGPRGIPGATGVHGHHDATSFELAYRGRTVIVDSGTYVYSADPDSHYRLKATKAHNVVVVDDEDMGGTPEGLWLLGDEAQAEMLDWSTKGSNARLVCAHHGYKRLESPVSVKRTFEMSDFELAIVDELSGLNSHKIELRFHTPLQPREVEGGVELFDPDTYARIAQFKFMARSEGQIFYSEEAQLGVTYGVYQQGWVFGWRFNSVQLPFTSSLSIRKDAGSCS